MTDSTHEAPERIWAWGWRADSVWQEQTWQHEDEPMSTMEYVRADLVDAAEQRGYANAMEAERKLHEDRIEALEAKLILMTTERDEAWKRAAHAEKMWGEAEIKLAKAMETLKECMEEIDAYIQQEYPHDHPVQERYRQRDYAANPARLALAEIKAT